MTHFYIGGLDILGNLSLPWEWYNSASGPEHHVETVVQSLDLCR